MIFHWAFLLAFQASPNLPPVVIAPPRGKGAAISISVSGHEQAPEPVTPRWTATDPCFSDLKCYLANWIAANSEGDKEKILRVWADGDRGELERRLADKPPLLELNARAFRRYTQWYYLGWLEFGDLTYLMIARLDGKEQMSPQVITLKRGPAGWGQTNDNRAETTANGILDLVAERVLRRNAKPAAPK